ncbi:MAG TPA: hypothetical protein VF981_00800 [Gemmatimonadaceae bacterium]
MLNIHALAVSVLLLGPQDSAIAQARQAGPAVDSVLSAESCALAPDPSRSTCVPASATACVVAVSAESLKVKVTDASRRACLSVARLIEPDLPIASDDNLRAGPPGNVPLSASADVHCRLKPRAESGGSLKFRCMRTNAQDQLYDKDGELAPDAVGFDAGGDLLDTRGEKVLDEDGEPREGDELRVKYFLGSVPAMRYREMFTETVVSRLFWALGIPVDHVYMPASVRCTGCSADPFGQKVAKRSPTPQVFTLASVEHPYDGKTIAVTRGKGFLGLGGKYDHGFGFDEIGTLLPDWPPSRRLEAEVMAIALNLVAYSNTHAYQNDLVCRKGAWDKATGACTDVVALVADVGGTLGGERAWWVKGMPAPEMNRFPRGDFITFAYGSVFTDQTTCKLRYDIGSTRNVSEAARRIMDERIRDRLGREQLRIIFEAASIHRMETQVNAAVGAMSSLQPGPALNRAVQLLWADEMMERFAEILTRRCPG